MTKHYRKLEQVVAGANTFEGGKRVDALLKTRGLISSLCLVEIKHHRTPLLSSKEYRGDCWPISDELAGSIAQIQRTVQKTIESARTKYEGKMAGGDPTGEVAFLYQPKAFVVIGCLDQFSTSLGPNETRYSSFELFRRNVTNPEIVTFDELYERAKFIVYHSGKGQIPDNSSPSFDETEIPY